MEWFLVLVLQITGIGERLAYATAGMSLKELLQERVICKEEFERRQSAFDEAVTIEQPTLRRKALDDLVKQALAECGVLR